MVPREAESVSCGLNNFIALSSWYGDESPLYDLRIVLLSMEIKVLPVSVVVNRILNMNR
jgi:hypothetical protein